MGASALSEVYAHYARYLFWIYLYFFRLTKLKCFVNTIGLYTLY